MKKLIVNTLIIRQLGPCSDRWANWLHNYEHFEGDILKFLQLEEITDKDKIWVALRILPREIVEVFAIDCAFAASSYAAANAVYAAAADAAAADAADADAAAYAADADAAAAYAAAAYAAAYAADAAAADAARKEQVEVLKWLIKDARKSAA